MPGAAGAAGPAAAKALPVNEAPLIRTTTGGVNHLTRHYSYMETEEQSGGFKGGVREQELRKEELEQWKSLAAQQEHEMDLAFEKVHFQDGQIKALKGAVDKLKERRKVLLMTHMIRCRSTLSRTPGGQAQSM